MRDRKTQDAVILKILVIGEAAAQILGEHGDFALQRTDIPWNQMKGMRDGQVRALARVRFLDVNRACW